MNLFLVRHGQAHPATTSDSARELTAQGREETRRIAEYLQRTHPMLDAIWTSPLVRARQTAAILHEVYARQPALTVQNELAHDGDINSLIASLASCSGKNLLLVSHQPLVGELLSLLVSGTKKDYHSELPFMHTSALAHIGIETVAPGGGELRDFKLPRDG